MLLPSDGYTIRVYSNNQQIGSFAGKAGLNYNAVPGLKAGGGQYLQVVNSAGSVVATATGTKSVLAQSSNSVCTGIMKLWDFRAERENGNMYRSAALHEYKPLTVIDLQSCADPEIPTSTTEIGNGLAHRKPEDPQDAVFGQIFQSTIQRKARKAT